MSESRQKFLKILRIELEDLIDAVEALVDRHRKRLEAGEITDYVFNENSALLTCEKKALQHFLTELGRIDWAISKTLEELAAVVNKSFEDFLKEHEYFPALKEFVQKKIKKVLDYCSC